jgi:hypothetical protein
VRSETKVTEAAANPAGTGPPSGPDGASGGVDVPEGAVVEVAAVAAGPEAVVDVVLAPVVLSVPDEHAASPAARSAR